MQNSDAFVLADEIGLVSLGIAERSEGLVRGGEVARRGQKPNLATKHLCSRPLHKCSGAIIDTGRGRAAAPINSEMVATYWQIGESILHDEQNGALHAAYGEGALERLGQVLSAEFGRGYNERSLRNMRQFYMAYPIRSTLQTESY